MERQPSSSDEIKSKNAQPDLVRDLTSEIEGLEIAEDSIIQEQCIYKVPDRIRRTDPQAYTPRVVSIGPYHNPFLLSGKDGLKPMEEVKLRHAKSFLTRTHLSIEDCVCKLKDWETRIRHCYEEPVQHNSDALLRMILIDAFFIIDLFDRYYKVSPSRSLLKPWLIQDIMVDLTLLENQLPFFVLEGIYNRAIASAAAASSSSEILGISFPSFLKITLKFFDKLNVQNVKAESITSPKHFTDLLRTFLLPIDGGLSQGEAKPLVKHLHSASQLSEAGLVFKPSPSKCLLDLKFHEDRGVLTMPCFDLDETEVIIMRNIIALEQCHHPFAPYVAEYLCILHFLISTSNDVDILVGKEVFINLLGDSNEVAMAVNNLCKGLVLWGMNSDYCSLCHRLNGFYENRRNKYMAILIHDYLNTPWKIASTIAAVVLLVLTLIQTVCSIIPLFGRQAG